MKRFFSVFFDNRRSLVSLFVIPGLMIFLFSSCMVFRSLKRSRADSTSSQEEWSSIRKISTESNLRHTRLSVSDSGKYRQEFQIVPDGEFVFSPETGFKGRAKSLVISGTQELHRKKDLSVLEKQELEADSGESRISAGKTQVSSTMKSREKRVPYGRTICIFLLVLLAVLVVWKWVKPASAFVRTKAFQKIRRFFR